MVPSLLRKRFSGFSDFPASGADSRSGEEGAAGRRGASGPVVGIPRGLLYFYHQPLWSAFFRRLGVGVVVSAPTDRALLERAQSLVRSDLCLPVKVFLAHVAELKDRVDWLLLPRVTSIHPDSFMCPKILGLVDMARSALPGLPRLLDPRINRRPGVSLDVPEALMWVGRRFTDDFEAIRAACRAALEAQEEFERRMLAMTFDEALAPWDDGPAGRRGGKGPCEPRFRVALIGRAYINFDPVLSYNLTGLLQSYGVGVVTAENLPRDSRDAQAERLPKKVYWQIGRDLVAAAMHYAEQPDIDGIINVSSFGCGQDSFTSALIEHHAGKLSGKPLLRLVLDEHSDNTGLKTRVEAFIDIMERAKRGGRPGARKDGPAGPERPKRSGKPLPESMHLMIPHMGYLHIGFESVFRRLGVQISMPPRPNKEALELGARCAPEGVCLPFKFNLGNMIQALESGVTDIIIPGGFGPCRFGYYGALQEQVLRELGYDFRMGRTDDPDSMRDMMAMVGRIAGLHGKRETYKLFFFILYRVALVDRALRLAHWTRPRETERRATDRAFRKSVRIIDDARTFVDLAPAMWKVERLFRAAPVDRGREVVRIGMVGEIFMVLENFANMGLEERLGEMGVEIHRGLWLSDWLNDRFHFKPWRRNQFRWALGQARPYLEDPSGGESVKTIGKSAWFARRGLDGIVHLMPFACMPELVSQTILDRMSSELKIPVLTLIYDEHTSPGALQNRLEAFVDLVKRRKRGR